MSVYQRAKGGWFIRVNVRPSAPTTELIGIRDNALRLNIKSPAKQGKANKECLRFLAALLGVNSWQLKIIHGEKSRNKVIEISHSEQIPIRERLKQL